MKRKAALLFILITLAGTLLSGCGMLTIPPQRMQFALEPTGNIGFEMNAAGEIVFTQRTMRFRNAAGANGVYITGFEIAYFDSAGNELSPSVVGNAPEQSMSLFVPPGIQCDEPDEATGCTMLSEGARIAPGPEVLTVESYQLMAAGVAERMIEDSIATGYFATDWYAEITFSGMTLDGQLFETEPYRLWISPPS